MGRVGPKQQAGRAIPAAGWALRSPFLASTAESNAQSGPIVYPIEAPTRMMLLEVKGGRVLLRLSLLMT